MGATGAIEDGPGLIKIGKAGNRGLAVQFQPKRPSTVQRGESLGQCGLAGL